MYERGNFLLLFSTFTKTFGRGGWGDVIFRNRHKDRQIDIRERGRHDRECENGGILSAVNCVKKFDSENLLLLSLFYYSKI